MKLDPRFGRPGAAPLTAAEYEAMLAVLRDCERAVDLQSFGERLVAALAYHLGYRHATVFLTSDMDRAAVPGRQRASRTVFHASWAGDGGLLADGEARDIVERRGVAVLARPSEATDDVAQSVIGDLPLPHGVRVVLGVRIDSGAGWRALIGVLDADGDAFTERDLALWQRLRVHLAPLLRAHARAGLGVPQGTLSRREEEVAQLLGRGLSNRDIAAALFITENTVKKHVTSILTATGMRSRTQFALRWGGGQEPRPASR